MTHQKTVHAGEKKCSKQKVQRVEYILLATVLGKSRFHQEEEEAQRAWVKISQAWRWNGSRGEGFIQLGSPHGARATQGSGC
jgi:hypothetical protein